MRIDLNPGDRIKVRHDDWHADLVIDSVPFRLRHSEHQSTATYHATDDFLWVNWDRYDAELFSRNGNEYHRVDLGKLHKGVNLHARPYAVQAGTLIEIDMLSLRLPNAAGSVFVRPATSDIPVFEAIFFAGDYNIDALDSDCNVIVDLGANTGLSSVYFGTRCPSARIIAVEPARSNFQVLAANVQNRPAIIPVEAAIWSRDCLIDLQDRGSSGAEWHAWAYRTVETQSGLGSYSVEAVCVPTLMQRYGLGFIDVLKIDIEGAEQEIFSRADLSWLDRVGTLIIETHERFCPGIDMLISQILHPKFCELSPNGENRVFKQRESVLR